VLRWVEVDDVEVVVGVGLGVDFVEDDDDVVTASPLLKDHVPQISPSDIGARASKTTGERSSQPYAPEGNSSTI